jgi:hypothetical protein
MKLMLSPRAVATFVFGALRMSPVEFCKELNNQRDRISSCIPSLLRDCLSRECYSPNAWEPDDLLPDLTVYFANHDLGSYFQKCGEFDVRSLRWRNTRHGIEISDLVGCERFDTQDEWERNYGDFDAGTKEEERHELYLEALREDPWPVAVVRFSVKMSFACLIEILVCRAGLGMESDLEVADSQHAQQWTDIFSTLTMIMARLPFGRSKLSPEDLTSEIHPLVTNSGKRKWPSAKHVIGRYNRPLKK